MAKHLLENNLKINNISLKILKVIQDNKLLNVYESLELNSKIK